MAGIIDKYYNMVIGKSISRNELAGIVETINTTSSFGNNNYSKGDLFLAISKKLESDDALVKKMFTVLITTLYADDQENIPLLLDQGSKRLFDDVWKNGVDGKMYKFWESKHSDSKQLESIYSDLMDKNNRGIDKNWLKKRRHKFFRHPNAPLKVLNMNLKNNESLIQMAKNPNLRGKPFEVVTQRAKINRNEELLIVLLQNKHLEWKKVADAIDITKLVSTATHEIPWFSDKKINVILEFCKHDDTPMDIKVKLFEYTKDTVYLPAEAKEVFLF